MGNANPDTMDSPSSEFDCGGPPEPKPTNSPVSIRTRTTPRSHDSQLRAKCTLDRGMWDKTGQLHNDVHSFTYKSQDSGIPSRIPRLALSAAEEKNQSEPLSPLVPRSSVERFKRDRNNEVLSPRSDRLVNSPYQHYVGTSTKSMRSSLGRSSLGRSSMARSSKSKIPSASVASISPGLLKPCLNHQPSPGSHQDDDSVASQDLEGVTLSVGTSPAPIPHFPRVEQSKIPKLMGRGFPVDSTSAMLSPRDGVEIVDGDMRRSLPMWNHCGTDCEHCKGRGCFLQKRKSSIMGRSDMSRSVGSGGGGTPRTSLSHLAHCSYTPPKSPMLRNEDWPIAGMGKRYECKDGSSGNSDDDALSSLFDETRDVRQSVSVENGSLVDKLEAKISIGGDFRGEAEGKDQGGEVTESLIPSDLEEVEISRNCDEKLDEFEGTTEFERGVVGDVFVSAAPSVDSSVREGGLGGVSQEMVEPRGKPFEDVLEGGNVETLSGGWKMVAGLAVVVCTLLVAVGFALVALRRSPVDPGSIRIRLKDRYPSATVCSPLSELQIGCMADPTSLNLYKTRGTCPSQAEKVLRLNRCPALLRDSISETDLQGGVLEAEMGGNRILSFVAGESFEQICVFVALCGVSAIFVIGLAAFVGRFRVGG